MVYIHSISTRHLQPSCVFPQAQNTLVGATNVMYSCYNYYIMHTYTSIHTYRNAININSKTGDSQHTAHTSKLKFLWQHFLDNYFSLDCQHTWHLILRIQILFWHVWTYFYLIILLINPSTNIPNIEIHRNSPRG